MGFLDSLKAGARNLQGEVLNQVKKFQGQDFADASMAVCALVASADGDIDPQERQKVAGFIASNDTLSHFDVSMLQDTFNRYCDKLSTDFDFGKIDLLQVIAKLRKKPEQARAAIQLAVIIGSADGEFDEEEKEIVREICRTVAISKTEFNL